MARTRTAFPCPRCRKNLHVCLCDEIVPIETTTRLVMLRHRSEIWRPSSTAGLLERALPALRIFEKDDPDGEAEMARLIASPETRPVFVFPDAGAMPLDEWLLCQERSHEQPPLFVMLDGSWRQVRRMRGRKPFLRGLPVVALRPDSPSAYRIRRQTNRAHLSTLEAVALLLSTVEGNPSKFNPLLDLFDRMVDRILALRGIEPDGR